MGRNRREEYTIRVIKETFLKLLEKNRVEKISVGELCEIADINRSTFYRHYEDIYALFQEVCDDCFNVLFDKLVANALEESKDEEYSRKAIRQACEISIRNKKLFSILLFQQPSSSFLSDLTSSLYAFFANSLQLSYPPSSRLDFYNQFLVSGIVGVWLRWMENDCSDSIDNVVSVVDNLVRSYYYILFKADLS